MDRSLRHWTLAPCAAAVLSLSVVAAQAQVGAGALPGPTIPTVFTWSTVANSATVIPEGDGRTFNSFNQPSVNSAGMVVMRARSRGGQGAGGPLRGIYSRQMTRATNPLQVVFDNRTEVPQPNNTHYNGSLGTFTEFPAFPRIGIDNRTIATRAQSNPVWTYTGPDGSETRAGTSGVYALHLGQGTSAAAQLGAAPGLGHYGVPGLSPKTRFDQFPGSPAVANANAIVFKGNYTDGVAQKTGVFFRALGTSSRPTITRMIASSDTLIPGQPPGGVRFGSTAPPSAAARDAVFVGLDNEQAPTLGGIYRARLTSQPALEPLVEIGGPVPGEPHGAVFNRLGEALSYDGRYVAFWGAWGDEVRPVTLICSDHGNAAVIAFCKEQHPDGLTVPVPVNQGVFVHDTQAQQTHLVTRTGTEFQDFLYWNFSGRPPGVGHAESEDFEVPRWRSTAFVATGNRRGMVQVAFKGRRALTPVPIDGIYVTQLPASPVIVRTVVETGMMGTLIDPMAPADVPVVSVGIERDGLRNGWLAVSAAIGDEEDGWAGIYVTRTGR